MFGRWLGRAPWCCCWVTVTHGLLVEIHESCWQIRQIWQILIFVLRFLWTFRGKSTKKSHGVSHHCPYQNSCHNCGYTVYTPSKLFITYPRWWPPYLAKIHQLESPWLGKSDRCFFGHNYVKSPSFTSKSSNWMGYMNNYWRVSN